MKKSLPPEKAPQLPPKVGFFQLMLLCLKLRRANLLIERRLNRYLRKAEIETVALGVLIAASEKSQSQIAIATALDIHPNSVTQICGRLQQMGYIERQQDPQDRRRSLVSLTPQGQILVREAKRTKLARLIFYPMDDEQIKVFDSWLMQLLDSPDSTEPFVIDW